MIDVGECVVEIGVTSKLPKNTSDSKEEKKLNSINLRIIFKIGMNDIIFNKLVLNVDSFFFITIKLMTLYKSSKIWPPGMRCILNFIFSSNDTLSV